VSELPEGWIDTNVAQVADDISYGYTASAIQEARGPKYLRITDIQNDTVDWGAVPHCTIPESKISNYELKSGDLVFARTGATTGKSFLIKSCPISVFASYLIRVRPSSSILPEFIARFFQSKSYWDQVSENISGSAQPNCNATKLSSLVLPLPPLAEQRRIVAKLETLLGKMDACQQRLAKIPAILKRFRQALLAAACSGQLTVDWRELHPPSSQVLFAGDEQAKTAPTVETSDTWHWVTLNSLCDESRGISYGVIKLGAEVPDGIPCLRTSDVKPLRIDASGVKRIAPEISADYKRTVLKGGEVLVNVRGTLGGVAVVLPEMKGWNISREVALVPLDSSVDAHFISFWVAARHSQNWLSNVEKGVAYTGINLEDLRLLPVALPSLSEQQEIVRRVEAFFKLADQLESRYQKAKAQVDKLQQSILAKAFRGELVPTEAELARREGRAYEPAAVLLERILAARAEPARQPKKKTRSQPNNLA
jgi:type I restriction enzyme, S subunit